MTFSSCLRQGHEQKKRKALVMKQNLIPVPGKVVISQEQIQQRVRELAAQISRDYAGSPLHLLAVLRGAVPFLSDLSRYLSLDVTFDYMAVTRRYAGNQVHILKDLDAPVEGRRVLLIEDIVNEGETLRYVLKNLSLRHPAEVKICTMFDRPGKRVEKLNLDYIGFELDDKYVVGYGLDYQQLYRNLPYLAELNLLK